MALHRRWGRGAGGCVRTCDAPRGRGGSAVPPRDGTGALSGGVRGARRAGSRDFFFAVGLTYSSGSDAVRGRVMGSVVHVSCSLGSPGALRASREVLGSTRLSGGRAAPGVALVLGATPWRDYRCALDDVARERFEDSGWGRRRRWSRFERRFVARKRPRRRLRGDVRISALASLAGRLRAARRAGSSRMSSDDLEREA